MLRGEACESNEAKGFDRKPGNCPFALHLQHAKNPIGGRRVQGGLEVAKRRDVRFRVFGYATCHVFTDGLELFRPLYCDLLNRDFIWQVDRRTDRIDILRFHQSRCGEGVAL
jgi:hypothetical protein